MKTKYGIMILLLSLTLMINAEKVTGSINDFGFDLMRQINTEDNIMISPYSVFTALAMTAEGADCNTLWQMRDVLHYNDNVEFIDRLRCLQKRLDKHDDNIELSVANALYLADKFTLEEPFKRSVENNFMAKLMLDDFSLESINNWVNEKTKGKIPTILDELDPLSKLVLLNAIYFKGKWQQEFNIDLTREKDFYLNSEEVVQVPMMNQVNTFPYYKNENTQIMQMNYKGSGYSMLIILPESNTDPDYWLNDMSSEKLDSIISNLKSERLDLSLPRFKIEFKRLLNSDLINLGMTDAFLPKADFSRINKETDLYIDIVVHKGYIEVDETGSEAAAATAVAMKMMSAGPPPTPIKFHADHPFIFLLMEDSMDLVLFAGIVNNPSY